MPSSGRFIFSIVDMIITKNNLKMKRHIVLQF